MKSFIKSLLAFSVTASMCASASLADELKPIVHEEPALGRPVEFERDVYPILEANCIACHNIDPAKAGGLGPEVKGSSRELLEARVVTATYPPGYTPKRPSAVMQPLPKLAGDIDALAAYLK